MHFFQQTLPAHTFYVSETFQIRSIHTVSIFFRRTNFVPHFLTPHRLPSHFFSIKPSLCLSFILTAQVSSQYVANGSTTFWYSSYITPNVFSPSQVHILLGTPSPMKQIFESAHNLHGLRCHHSAQLPQGA